jgi:hypothetical protein
MAAEWTRKYFASGVAAHTEVHRMSALPQGSLVSGS